MINDEFADASFIVHFFRRGFFPLVGIVETEMSLF